ncbi:uncharacterized protein LOC115626112 [Scaptodrosophila lebanonensis]|uniref:Uncharacterized protein LOC115626112 n=1 Tax=Drosophila lebanonensis TaxID=7225 RepID=A0A6J2TQJ9_DROLE|nr:uncharacterized protein LOC115626112 [Scaptodrosophila lebanonensis]XP_030377227.1 uncharacterized protein LOC115626112 [Scaptodrosophila lebanonensis]
MTSILPILFISFVHLVTHTSIIIHQRMDGFVNVPKLASYITYATIMDVIYDIQVIPKHWSHLPGWGKFVIETLFTLLVAEFGIVLVWSTLEAVCITFLLDTIEMSGLNIIIYPGWRRFIIAIATVSLSLSISLAVSTATNRSLKVILLYRRIVDYVQFLVDKYLKKQCPSVRSILKQEMQTRGGVPSILRTR